MNSRPGLLLVANFDSGVGYAWWLMESFWATLARHYAASHETYLAFPTISSLSATLEDAPLTAHEQGFGSRSPRALLAQCRYIRRHRIRTMYFSDWGTWRLRYALYRLAGVRRIIIHDHTPGVRRVPGGAKCLLKTLLNRTPLIAADGALGATDYVRQRLVNVACFPATRCFAVPNGLPELPEDDMEPADVRALFDIPAGRRILVMTGRAHRYKGVDFVLECLARLARSGQRGLHFLFVGDGPHLAAFQAAAMRTGIMDYCTFAGRRTDVPGILAGCDFAIHPSKGEVGYSLSILEYMRAGLPVVVPDNPSVCAATEHRSTGLLYRDGDVESATRCLEQLLSDPEFARRMGAAGRQAVATRYRLETTHAALLAAFARLDPLS